MKFFVNTGYRRYQDTGIPRIPMASLFDIKIAIRLSPYFQVFANKILILPKILVSLQLKNSDYD